MKAAALLENRRKHWEMLDRWCSRPPRRADGAGAAEFASLYRAACADLALADAYQLPPNTVQYLHRLVGRAHNQLYRSRRFQLAAWGRTLLVDVPRGLLRDSCVQVAWVLFWVTFLGSAGMAYRQLDWAVQVMPPEMMEQLEENFGQPLGGRDPQLNYLMAAFYIQHNTSIGLRCFAWGILILPGLQELLQNALVLGAAFGYMARPEIAEGSHFFHFVTAHGPFELTAIALAAGAGLRLGIGWLKTDGWTRAASLQRAAREAMPIMGAAMVMFLLAALIEGFVSPTGLPYWVKATVALLSGAMLVFYFVVLGIPRRAR